VTAPAAVAVPASQSVILRLQEAAGNRALQGLLARTVGTFASSVLVQREKSERHRQASSRERALRSLRGARDARDLRVRLRRMQVLFAADDAALAGLGDAYRQITAEQDEVEALRNRRDVVYADPPLDEREGRRRLALIERDDPAAFEGLLRQGSAFRELSTGEYGALKERLKKGDDAASREIVTAEVAVEHEWGLGIARTAGREAMLIVGDATGVAWPTEIVNSLTPIAHSHPYFEKGPARHRAPQPTESGEGTTASEGRVSIKTKEIADHQIGDRRIPGAVLWSDLAHQREVEEMQKIFPSASDVAFSARKGVTRHTVYTPYLVLRGPKDAIVIANPTPAVGKERLQKAPRLRFEIRNAFHIKDADYGCTLAAIEDNEFWTKDIVTEGDGQFAPIKW
jgi:hypothetical protein